MRGHIKRVVERRAIRRRRRLRIPVAAVDKPHNLIRIFKRNVVVSRSTRLPIINEGTVRMRSLLQYRHYNTLFRNQLGLVFRYFYKRLLYDTSSYLFYRTILLAPNAFS